MNGWNLIRDRYRVAVDPLLTERNFELAILFLILLLVLQLVYGASRLTLLSAPEAVLPAEDSLQVQESYQRHTITEEQSAEIQNRPLFWPERRPVADVVKEPESTEEKQEFKGFKLIGLFGVGESIGIIVQAEGKTVRLRPGEELDGWTLDSVGGRQAEFSSGARKETLILKPENQKAGAGRTGNRKSKRGR